MTFSRLLSRRFRTFSLLIAVLLASTSVYATTRGPLCICHEAGEQEQDHDDDAEERKEGRESAEARALRHPTRTPLVSTRELSLPYPLDPTDEARPLGPQLLRHSDRKPATLRLLI